MIDAFLFNDELDILKFRLALYNGFFNKVIIFESDVTFSGKPKPCFAQDNIDLLQKITRSEILVKRLDTSALNQIDFEERWPVEKVSREQFMNFLSTQKSERIIFGDLDEFPSFEQIKWLIQAERLGSSECYIIPMSLRYRKVNWKVSNRANLYWKSTISFSPQYPPKLNQKRKYNFSEVPGTGLHLSYLDLKAHQISKKFSEFSHSEYSGFDSLEPAIVKFSNKYGLDHLGRASIKNLGLLTSLPVSSLDQFESIFLKMKPLWFDFSIFPGKLSRLAASILITEVRERDAKAISLLLKLEAKTGGELTFALAVRIVSGRVAKKVKERIKMSVLSPSRYKLDWDS